MLKIVIDNWYYCYSSTKYKFTLLAPFGHIVYVRVCDIIRIHEIEVDVIGFVRWVIKLLDHIQY